MGRLRQAASLRTTWTKKHEFQVSLGNLVRPCLKRKKVKRESQVWYRPTILVLRRPRPAWTRLVMGQVPDPKMLVLGPVQNQANKFGISNSCSWRLRKSSWKRRKVCQGLGSRKAEQTAGALGSSRPAASAAPDVAWQPGWRAVRTEATGQSGSPGRTIATTGTAGSLPFPLGPGDALPPGSWDSRGLPFGRARQSSTHRSLLRSARSTSCQPRQPARRGIPPDVGCR